MRLNKTNIQARLKVLEEQAKRVNGVKVLVYQYTKNGTIKTRLNDEEKNTFKSEKDLKVYQKNIEQTCDLLISIRDVDETEQE
ncbi:hypothetical protein ACI3EJ_01920 [Ligilactobacillus acidipiscis]|uniref:hypothetical protein n=1 Tax=Ligilactobacillus acidipiscis TaxID=89059 RepID=UPI0038707406